MNYKILHRSSKIVYYTGPQIWHAVNYPPDNCWFSVEYEAQVLLSEMIMCALWDSIHLNGYSVGGLSKFHNYQALEWEVFGDMINFELSINLIKLVKVTFDQTLEKYKQWPFCMGLLVDTGLKFYRKLQKDDIWRQDRELSCDHSVSEMPKGHPDRQLNQFWVKGEFGLIL